MEEQKPNCVLFTAKADFISLMTKRGRSVNLSVTSIRNEEMERRYIGKPGLAESHQL
jgi:hypothetical protein